MNKTLFTMLLFFSAIITVFADSPDTMLRRPQPLLLMENRGQVLNQYGKSRTDVLFTCRKKGVKIAILANGISYQFEKSSPSKYSDHQHEMGLIQMGATHPSMVESYRLDVQLQGANPHPRVEREAPDTYYENYYNIPDAPDGILGVRAFGRVVLRDVYPGIDWVFYTLDQRLKYDFVVHPGADPGMIRLEYLGAKQIEQQPDGSMLVKTLLGEINEAAPVSFSGIHNVKSSYRLSGKILSFALDAYDRSLPLTIDPALVWGTYYGGDMQEVGSCTSVDATGNVYLGGFTSSLSGIASGGHQNFYSGGNYDAFLVKFNSAGIRQWATYYGGTQDEKGVSVAVDGTGNVYFAGWTNSTSSIAAGGHQNMIGGFSEDAFLVKFNGVGVRQWGTYYGGTLSDAGASTYVDGSGNIYLAGRTHSTSGIAFGEHQNTIGGNQDAFLVKFNNAGVRLWSTYYGGSGADQGWATFVDGAGNVYLGGATMSTNNIAYAGHQNTFSSSLSDAFLVKFNSAGVRQWATYYGGTSFSGYSCSVAADGSGNVYLTGFTTNTSGVAYGGHQSVIGGNFDAFLVKFNSAGVRQWGTYYGGVSNDGGLSTAVDGSGNIYLAGVTASTSDIAFNGYQNTNGGGDDAFLVKFNGAGVRQWGTYYGGESNDSGSEMALDGSGNLFLAGSTASDSGIAFNGHQNTRGGLGFDQDAFLAKLTPGALPVANFSASPTTITVGQSVQFTDLSSSSPTSWAWSFQGGTPSTASDQNPSVTYNNAGIYNVTLIAANGTGNDLETKSAYVTVNPGLQAPIADFSADQTNIPVDGFIVFTDQSQNSPTHWNWTFPGGFPANSSLEDPIIIYPTQGIYNVSLVASNQAGSDEENKIGYIKVGSVSTEEPKEGGSIDIQPNPVHRGQSITIDLLLNHGEELEVYVVSTQGVVIKQLLHAQLKKGATRLEYSTERFKSGAYFLVFQNADKTFVHSKRMVVVD